MVKVITEEIQNVQISNCRFDAPRKFHELFWNWNQIRRSRKKQSCIDFALNFLTEEISDYEQIFSLVSYD